jgi:hypothetical protein
MADYDLQYQDTHIDALLATANELKTAGYIYKGVATPSTNPGTPTDRVAYLASEPGTYTNFGGIVIASGLYSLTYAGGTWTGTQMQAGSDIEVVQTTGQSTSDVMSQKAVTDELVDIGKECEDKTTYDTEAVYGNWQSNTGAISTKKPIRAHLKVSAKNKNYIQVIVPAKFAFTAHYVNDSNILVETIHTTWQDGVVEFSLNGTYDIMLNIKYDAGTAVVTQGNLTGVMWNITLYSHANGFASAAPYASFLDIQKKVDNANSIALSDMTPISLYITANTGVWTNNTLNTSFLYQLRQGQDLVIEANSLMAASIAFIDTFSPTAGASATFKNNTQGVISVDISQKRYFHIFEDCVLYVLVMTSTPYYRFPTSILLYENRVAQAGNAFKVLSFFDIVTFQTQYYHRVYFYAPVGVYSATPNSGYQVAIIAYDNANNILLSTGWTNGFAEIVAPQGTGYVLLNVRKTNDAAITIDEAKSNIEFVLTDLNAYNAKRGVQYPHEYYGEEINIKKRFNFVYEGAFPASVTPTQGMAIYGNYCVQGSSTESNGKTKAELIDLSTRTSIANLLLEHTGYDAIHCNVMCFGVEIPTNGIMPALYASQWDGQTCCFVYDIKTTGATLLQVIDPSQLTKNGTTFGIGYVDWVVDTDHKWLFALSYTQAGYSGGLIVTKFNLPLLSAGSLVQLTDADIISSNYIGEYVIRQDACYNGNKLFLLYGSPNGYTSQQYIHVIDVFSLNEVSTLPMLFATTEPEGLDIYNEELVIHFINENVLQKIVFK